MPPERTLPAAPDGARLERRALAYLQRHPASRARLARVLRRRAEPEARAHGLDVAELDLRIRAVVERLAAAGAVDDAVYAAGRARALLRRGRPAARVRQELGRDGIPPDLIDEVLARLLPPDDPELASAVRYARRRGLGPFRPEVERQDRRDRDLRALVRQGFPLPVARAVIDAATADVLDDALV